MKTCSRCKIEKPLDEFYPHKRAKSGWSSHCKICDAAAKRKYYLNNKQSCIDRAIDWKHNNPDSIRQHKHKRRAALKAGGIWTVQEWNDILDKYDHKCLKCGTTENITVDHVIPLVKGGTNTADNIQPLCLECNCRKWTDSTDYRY